MKERIEEMQRQLDNLEEKFTFLKEIVRNQYLTSFALQIGNTMTLILVKTPDPVSRNLVIPIVRRLEVIFGDIALGKEEYPVVRQRYIEALRDLEIIRAKHGLPSFSHEHASILGGQHPDEMYR